MANIIKPKRGPRLPTTTDLVDGEIAINTVDKKLYSNIGGTVYELSPSILTPAGSNTQVQFNNNGAFGASANFTFNSDALTVKNTLGINKTTGFGGLYITAGATTTTAQCIATNLEFVINESSGRTMSFKNSNGTNLLQLTLDSINNIVQLTNEVSGLTTAFLVEGTIEATVHIDAPHFIGSLLGATQQQCRNDTASTITKGTPVYITGYSGSRVLIAPAEASNSAKMPAVGLLDSDIAANSIGHYTILGVAKNLNTTGYQVNETLYVGTNGGLTNVRPTGATTLIQNIGKVVNVGTNGEILVMGPGRSNDVPNTLTARTGLISNDGYGISLFNTGSTYYLKLQQATTLARNITLIFPNSVGGVDDTLAITSSNGTTGDIVLGWKKNISLSDANTFTAQQSFSSGLRVSSGNIEGLKTAGSTLTVDNGLGNIAIVSPLTSIGDLATGTLTTTGNITLQNSEFIRNSTNGRIDLMPNGTTSTHFGIYFDTTGWGFGTQIGTIRASDGLLNTGGSILWNSPLVVAADTNFVFGSNSAYRIRNSSTGNDTLQIALAGGAYTATNSNSLALVDVNGIGTANRSPATNHTNPNLYVYRNGTASANDFIRMEHDGTDGALYSGGSTNIALSPGSGTVKVNNKLTLGTSTLNSSVGGCLEYDGKVLYGNASSGRGVVPVMQIASVATTKSLNSATGNQDIFDTANNLIQLAANTTYIIRGCLLLNTGTTTARHLTLRFTDGVTVNPPTIHFSTIGTPSTGGAAQRAQDTAFFNTTGGGTITNQTFTTNNYNAWITGVIKTVDAVTITPQIAFSAAPGGTNTVGFGTYIAFIPVGSDTLASVGPWS